MFLGLDLGTTNVKAIVADAQGRIHGQGSAPVRLLPVGDGGIEQDLDEIWASALEAIRQATAAVNREAVRAIGVSSQGGAMQAYDQHGRPFGGVVSWLDLRGRVYDQALDRELGPLWFAERVGHRGSGLAIGQVLRLRRQSPSLFHDSSRIGFVGDQMVERLSGRAAHDGTSAGLTLLYNPRKRTYDPDLLARLGLQTHQLPGLSSPRSAAGGLRPEVARLTGLVPGIPVSPAVHDQYAAALGTAVVHPGDVMFGAGTAWVLLAVMDHLTEPVTDNAFVCHHVVADVYGQLLSLRNGGSALTWALQLLGIPRPNAIELDRMMASVPAGSDGLQCWPFFAAPGASGSDQAVRGQFSGLTLAHTAAHFVRAVVEGLACELNRHLGFLRRANIPVCQLMMCGAAAASAVTPQLIADVTGIPVGCRSQTEGSLIGAAILARGLVESQRSLSELAAEMVPGTQKIEPGSRHRFYQDCYRDYLDSLRVIDEKGDAAFARRT